MNTSGHYYFHEEQDFRRSWILFLVIMIVLATIIIQIYGLYQQIYLEKPWGDNPMTNNELLITTIASVVAVILGALIILNLRLITEVRTEGFFYRFPILINRQHEILKERILSYEVGKYHPLRDFGGWGIKKRLFRKTAYSVKGAYGVTFHLDNGKTILFGTQKPDELKRALDRMMASNKN